MQNLKTIICILTICLGIKTYSQSIHHELNVDLNISDRSIEVIDSVTIPAKHFNRHDTLFCFLNKNLKLQSLNEKYIVSETEQNDTGAIFNKYIIKVSHPVKSDLKIPLKHYGKITDEITTGAAEYARGFSETDGIITDEGVFMAGSTYWIPLFEEPLFSFNLTVTLRPDWNVVSQGNRTINEIDGDNRKVRYESPEPMEEVYLISAAWTEYEQKAGDVLVQAFLRTPDEELASRYIGVTSNYLKMYESLIGQYPYQKFALIENFWETGYGMPSFTLLGEKVIRFPFILHSSYPHELLHNWWGNSVYVNYENGNWCEGITVYMADHLIKEQRGQGSDYRRTTLQKFTDYVNETNDFPVVEFRSRHNAAEEAIGYGKATMFNHMLRKKLGDEKFVQAYRTFYIDNKFKITSFDDIRKSFEKITDSDLKPFFDQWLLRKGAPEIKLSDVKLEKTGDRFDLEFTLSQIQKEDIFLLNIPVAIYFEDEVELKNVDLNKRSVTYNYKFQKQPLKIEVDPQFDVFRRLDKAEVPPSLSQVFGNREGMIVLPKNSSLSEEYSKLAETWKMTQEVQGKSLDIVFDKDLEKLPDDKAVWIIGFENKFAGVFSVQEDYSAYFDEAQTELINELSETGSLVYAIPNPENNLQTIGFIGTNVKEAVPGLTRLLSHYGKYSYLGFEGERPNNVLKGSFPALNSPLHYSIPYDGQTLETKAKLKHEKALAEYK
ncbi:MAG: hypothetical protein H8D45_27020 [Bacteroidetes bacterium]|nr:hypothetical protein [Bacteroidota bacterium]MBL7105301.1 hypothetical protein [Bacteroidales bacterium]